MIKRFLNFGKGLVFSKTAKQTYVTTFGAGTNAFLGFIFTIIIARTLNVSDFGVFSVISSLVLIFLGLADLGTISGATRFLPTAAEEEKPKIIKIVYLVTFSIGFLLTILLVLTAKPLSFYIFKTTNLSPLIILAAPAILGLSLWTVGFGVLYAQKRFVKGILVDTSVVIFKLIVVLLILLAFRLTLSSTILAFSLTPFLAIILSLLFIPPKFLLVPVSRQILLQIFSFSAWIFLAKIAVTVLGQIDIIMLARIKDSAATGLYAAANRITFVFPVLANGLSVVLMPKFAGFNQVEEAKKFLRKVMLVLALFIIPIAISYLFSDLLVLWIYGTSYAAAAEVLRFLLLRTIFFIAATGPLTMLVYFFGQSKMLAFISLAQVLILILSNLIFIPRFGAVGPAISGAISYGIVFWVSLYLIVKKIKEA